MKDTKGWSFDSAAGKQEVLYRRIGRNELDTIQVCRAIIEAEGAYFRTGHDGNPPGVFTKKLRSDPGKENGLYWETAEGEPGSPAGPLLAEASSDGYELGTGKHQPFHGYLYRVLSAQGPHARGGARDYVVDGKMTRGFAVVAYPVEYRSSGVMTFIVNQHGVVYQKDLGDGTAAGRQSDDDIRSGFELENCAVSKLFRLTGEAICVTLVSGHDSYDRTGSRRSTDSHASRSG